MEREGTPRRCPECGQEFRPMGDALWVRVLAAHERVSTRHRPRRDAADA